MNQFSYRQLGFIKKGSPFAVFKLVIEATYEKESMVRPEVCEFDEFCSQIRRDGSYESELDRFEALLILLSENARLPPNKIKSLKGIPDAFELKTKHLRLYLFHKKEIGQIVVCGGKKTDQDGDIRHLKKIISQL